LTKWLTGRESSVRVKLTLTWVTVSCNAPLDYICCLEACQLLVERGAMQCNSLVHCRLVQYKYNLRKHLTLFHRSPAG